MRARVLFSALAWATSIALASGTGWAFCRATTCDPADPAASCSRDQNSCLNVGQPLFWDSSCVTVSVQQDGSPINQIDFATALRTTRKAFDSWTGARCADGENPSIRVEVAGPVSCARSEYNEQLRNANIVMFRENDWPYQGAGDTLGITRVRFAPSTGVIWDADIELNATAGPLSVGDPVDGGDLLSVLTHEAGHLLGLDHTTVETGTMFAEYEAGDSSQRSLAPDDVNGICEIYPASRKPSSSSCEARHGFSALCGAEQTPPEQEPPQGCSFSAAAPSTAPLRLLPLGLLLLLAVARRRTAGLHDR